ncbi:MAG: hypothetical protein NTZ84_01380 [Candidatus Nealsonbacteria bacterium]|nr:hypothetical protein [Candidatus Nealsonbacteria bacterium]
MSNNIEIEFRAIISKKKYEWLDSFLEKNAKDLGQDDKETVFYILPGKLFKVVNETSKNKAKIVLKDRRIGHGSDFREWEIKIDSADYEAAVKIFDHLSLPGKSMKSWQKRHNYLYKRIEIAVKYSKHWKYHIEMEIVVGSPKKKEYAEGQIKNLADELGIKLMTDEEIKKFTNKIESKL